MKSTSSFVLIFLCSLWAFCPVHDSVADVQGKQDDQAIQARRVAARSDRGGQGTSGNDFRRSDEVKTSQGKHDSGWEFRQGVNSRDAWNEAMPMESLQRRAVEHSRKHENNKGMNTTSGIDSALKEAEKRGTGSMGISIKQEASSWHEDVGPESAAPDENLPMESRHVVQAYAGMKTDDDLSIKVGPELILKDDKRENPHADNRQPDSSLGVGMQFKLDF